MSAQFYQEQLGVSLAAAKRIASFMAFARSQKAIESPQPWAKHQKARVYFSLWSQNNRNPIEALQCVGGAYYCAETNEIHLKFYRYGLWVETLSQSVSKYSPSYYSGAKTREEIKQMARCFYEQKNAWD